MMIVLIACGAVVVALLSLTVVILLRRRRSGNLGTSVEKIPVEFPIEKVDELGISNVTGN